ncbi:hypothetical protein B7755_037755 [Streptomyces sp. NBS 14/10]|nr:hypothetical protein [Streptomyces sp. NBS 14/10]KAK1183376.1 hypothetical protein B7755_037755 [Streptomyces sp. NBS 14/10]
MAMRLSSCECAAAAALERLIADRADLADRLIWLNGDDRAERC